MKVFLSSTAQDLSAYRQVADDTILRLSQQAVVMERFGPLPGEPVAECESKARESDVVVCIVAHRFGFVPEKGRGSITQREVEAAKAAGKDVLVWIVADDYAWIGRKEQDLLTDPNVLADPERVAEVAAGVAALVAFKTWLRANFVCDTFTTPDELGRKIAVSLSNRFAQPPPSVAPRARKQGEIRIVHALQAAPHFHGRDAVVKELMDWVADPASPDRVWAVVAAGGTGKTAIVERVIRDLGPGEANVLVWSFYEKPEADAFLRECNHLFLGEEDGPAGGQLERLERGLRDGRPHLIVLDGLERVQADVGSGRVRGELSDQTLKLLLRVLTNGLGRARVLVTSRFPLVDLQDWAKRGYRETHLDDLTPEAGVAVLRGWGVVGDDAALRAASLQVGHHALSVAVVGSYLHSFAAGRVDEVNSFDLDAVRGDDPKAAKLARVLAFYADRLPGEERDVLARLSVFPRGVTVGLLRSLVDAGGDVAGILAGQHLVGVLTNLKARGLVFEYPRQAEVIWTAHPFLRERFRNLLGCSPEQIFDVVARSLGSGLNKRPKTMSTDPKVLDEYEHLIEMTRLAGHEHEAFNLFMSGMDYGQLVEAFGEYERGYRILSSFSATGKPEHLGQSMIRNERRTLANNLAFFALSLGRLEEARAIQQVNQLWRKSSDDSRWLQNTFITSFALGRLVDCHAMATSEVALARSLATKAELLSVAGPASRDEREVLIHRARAAHALGDIASARADFVAATELGRVSIGHSVCKIRHHLDLGELAAGRILCTDNWERARTDKQNRTTAWFEALLGRLDLIEGNDPTPRIESLRSWTSRSGDMEQIIEAHLLSAKHFFASSDLQTAFEEAQAGLLHAVSCGYRLLRIELLIVLARIRLAWPDSPKAIQAAREALDLSAHPECQYAWGEADAAQVWGEAYFANHEPALANGAFTRALAVRKRIEHPGVAETERWLARTS